MLTIILAQIRTLDHAPETAEAVLVGGGRVLAVGARDEMRALAPRADVLDHRDLVLTPGLVDAHVHLVGYGASLGHVALADARSVEEVRARVRERAAVTPPGAWIIGSGFTLQNLGVSRYLTAADLDDAAPHHPVMLSSADLHMAWVNSRALALGGVTDDTPDPEGGHLPRPLGTLLEYAKELVTRAIPTPTDADLLADARRAARDFEARGFVGVHTMGFESAAALRAVQALDARGELPLSVWACVDHTRLEAVRDSGLRGNAGRERGNVVIGGLKFFADGALGSRTAWLFPPGFADGSGEGLPLHSPDLIRERAREGLDLGLIPVTHAIGDRAVHEVLNVYADLAPLAREKGVRLRLEHAQHVREDDLPRFGQLGVTASVQPIHLLGDGPAVRTLLPHLEHTTYAFRRLLDAGALLALGSDAPVAPPDVGATFRAATTRLDDTGHALAPHEALTVDEVLFAYTRGPALAVGWDDHGLIRPGARAAFTLWDEIGGAARALVFESARDPA